MEQLINNTYFQAFMILLIVTLITIFTKVYYPSIKTYFKNKGIEFTDQDTVMMRQILEAVNYVSIKLGYEISDELKTVTQYVYKAIAFVKEVNQVEDIEILIELVQDKTQEIMQEKGIVIDEDIKKIIQTIIDYAVVKSSK